MNVYEATHGATGMPTRGVGCLLPLALFPLAAAATWAWLGTLPDSSGEARGWVALAAGVCVAVSAWYTCWFPRTTRDRGLVRRALAGDPPRPGQRAAVVGVVGAASRLTAPLTGTPAVAYRYEVSQPKHWSTSRTRTYQLRYRGSAMVPCTVAGAAGTFPLGGMPALAFGGERVAGERAQVGFAAHAATATFEEVPAVPPPPLPHAAEAAPAHRVDQAATGELAWPTAFAVERVLRPGEEVCVVGHYEAGVGFVVEPRSGRLPVLYRGGAAEALGAAAEPRRQAISGAVFFLLAAAAMLGAYWYFAAGGG